jgi:hypothetical protein
LLRQATSSPSYITTDPRTSTTQQQSQRLLSILLARYRKRSGSSGDSNSDAMIGDLIESLSEAKVEFDPAETFNGPLYAVLHQQGPKVPLWEKISLVSNNIKGQKYTYKPETRDFDIVNYAEIIGKGEFPG